MTAIPIIGAAISFTLAAATPQAQPIDSLYSAAGQIIAVEEQDDTYKVSVILSGAEMPYDGHVFTIDLPSGDMQDWEAEQGPIHNGDNVNVWMDANETQEATDDEISHIRKI